MTEYETYAFINAMFRLFKRIPKFEKATEKYETNIEKNLKNGFVFSDEALTYGNLSVGGLGKDVEQMYSRSSRKYNNTFFDSIKTVKDIEPEKYYVHQILNYITFHMSDVGFLSQDEIYVPNEEIGIKDEEIPPYHITVVRLMDKDETKERVEHLLFSGVALKSETVTDIFNVAKAFDFINDIDISKVKNKEARLRFYKETEKTPKNGEEMVRYLYYLVTGNTMLVKSKDSLRCLNSMLQWSTATVRSVNKAIETHVKQYGYKPLAEVFYTNKKLLLVFKNNKNSYHINKIRRLADKYKQPKMPKILDRLSQLTEKEFNDFKKEFDKMPLFKKVALANYGFTQANEKITDVMYWIRNGKVFLREDAKKNQVPIKFFKYMINSIVQEVKPLVEGKKVYIPKNMDYAFPTSEKKFIGGIPCGSVFSMERKGDVICGIHWLNADNGTKHGDRTDLDLHVTSATGEYVGWNSYYESGGVWFTGDMTDAPRDKGGAAELMYFDKEIGEKAYILTINNFTDTNYPFPFSLVVGNAYEGMKGSNCKSDLAQKFCKDFINNTCQQIEIKSEMKSANCSEGILLLNEETARFVFTDMRLSGCIAPRSGDFNMKVLNYLQNYTDSLMKLKDVLKACGVEFVEQPTEDCINLDYNELGNTTILDLFRKDK